MKTIHDYFSQLLVIATQRNHRFGIVVRGSDEWQQQCLVEVASQVDPSAIYQLGGDASVEVSRFAKFNKGQQLLGQECQLLICDFRAGFDANSFTAATGCVRGGGLIVIVTAKEDRERLDQMWLANALDGLIQLHQDQSLPQLPSAKVSDFEPYRDQQQAIEKIIKVMEGHRKRPLVMTADRGRGKSSALGIAAAQLMQSRTLRIVVTAPSIATVQPVFEHASRLLNGVKMDNNQLCFQQSILEFVAPDELLRNQTELDFLLVDEASAIPIPMLQSMVERYHRAVFSTTIHGYEGCGRGFSLKFQTWLKQQRPGTSFYHLQQPIRWATDDPLEKWLFDSFLLNSELMDLSSHAQDPILQRVDKRQLISSPEILNNCFALLVNAHYQTSPNDLMLLLADDAIHLYTAFDGDICLGCILAIEEGKLPSDLLEQICMGKRRPKGHLVATTLANQLGITEAAQQSSLRIMRIAVHPQGQRKRIGQQLIRQLIHNSDYDFYSTSFGATSELVQFWHRCGFASVRLGSQRDQASGTHSLVMVKGNVDWLNSAREQFFHGFDYSLSTLFAQLEIELVRSLIANKDASVDKPSFNPLIERYCLGGASYESVAPHLYSWWQDTPSLAGKVSDFFIRLVVQRNTWSSCIAEFGFAGRKQAEQVFRQQLGELLT